MKRIIRTGAVIMIMLSMVSLLAGCAARHCTGPVVYFNMAKGGSWMDGWSITVRENESGETELIYTEDEHYDYGEMKVPLDDGFIEKLTAICNEHKVKNWNGFNKNARGVLDGSSFSLSVGYEGGGEVYAHGYMRYPRGYSEFRDDVLELCEPYIDKALETARAEKIAAGVEGDCRLILGNFHQRGLSGSDTYEFLITASDVRDNNFDVKINSKSGEFFPEGEYRYYCAVPDEVIDFDALERIVEELDITEWMDYNRSAEDYDNREWFQIELSFETGEIQATGSEHPEHYDEFRTAVFNWLRDTVDKARDAGYISSDPE